MTLVLGTGGVSPVLLFSNRIPTASSGLCTLSTQKPYKTSNIKVKPKPEPTTATSKALSRRLPKSHMGINRAPTYLVAWEPLQVLRMSRIGTWSLWVQPSTRKRLESDAAEVGEICKTLPGKEVLQRRVLLGLHGGFWA